MKKLLTKLLFRLLRFDFDFGDKIDFKLLQLWLFKSYEDKGFKQYYSLRKKALKDYLSLELPEKEYLKALGRLNELHSLSENIKREWERVKKVQKHDNKKVQK